MNVLDGGRTRGAKISGTEPQGWHMPLTKFLPRGIAAVLLFAACKDSSGPGPQITYPTLPSAFVSEYCIRGDRTVGNGISGTLATTDCPFGDGSYYETWRLRLAAAGSYRFAASSSFDNLLAVLRLDSTVGSEEYFTALASDDDSGPGTNALISSVALESNTDYFLIVNGFDATDVGPYSVTFSRP